MKAKLKSFFGAWVVEVGETVFPTLFADKKKAMEVVNKINNRDL